jgi:hypothetical protein
VNKKRNLVVAVIVTAAAGLLAVQNALAPPNDDPSNAVGSEVNDPDSGTVTPAYEGCAFISASHEAPELTEKVDAAVRALNPEASASAILFGEDCVYGDGHSTFSTMETDFDVRLPVQDLTDYEFFGVWMKQVLDAILQIPREDIKGNDGLVNFWFIMSQREQVIVHVPIQQYRTEAPGNTGQDLFFMFFEPPVIPALT